MVGHTAELGVAGTHESIEPLIVALRNTDLPSLQMTFLKAIRAALAGQRSATQPDSWTEIYQRISKSTDDELTLQARSLGVVFGDSLAINESQAVIDDPNQSEYRKWRAIEDLVAVKDLALVPKLLAIVTSPKVSKASDPLHSIRDVALRGLAQYEHPEIASTLLGAYGNLSVDERRLAISTLCSRENSAMALLKAMQAKEIPTSDLSADMARQLEYVGGEPVKAILAKVWGQVRSSPADKVKLIEDYKRLVANNSLPPTDENLGRAVFAKTCQRCHVLYGQGQHLGPDLTGSNRANIDYLLENIVDPSAVMANEYRQSIVLTTSGQVITGIVRSENEKTLNIQTADAMVAVPKDEIEERKVSEKSMMPDDQLNQFSPHEIRSLLSYLRTKEQVPMLATQENTSQIFNERDLTHWKGNLELWSVKDGEIIGKSNGLERNEFLVSDLIAADFSLSVEIMLMNNAGNSGIQFRSVALSDGKVQGYQADAGKGWWGKLYEEEGRKLLWDKSGEQHVKDREWNTYRIEAIGSKIRTSINGNACVELDDPPGRKKGIFALQLHSGGPTEVRFRNIQLKVDATTRDHKTVN